MNEEQIAQLVLLLIQSGAVQDENQAMEVILMASQGDELAQLVIQLVVQLALGGTPSARLGAKLNYLMKLKGVCPEDQELVFFKAGGRLCKKCMKCGGKTKKKMACGGKSLKNAKGGILANKGTAFGDGKRGANPRNTDRGGHKSHGNTKAAWSMKKTNVPNKFTAFGDTGRKKPTNVGLVGHKATGKTGRMQSKYTTSDNVNKHTAFGAHINRSHRQSSAGQTFGWSKIKGAPKGGSGQSMGWKKYANGGTLTEAFVNYFQNGGSLNGTPFRQ